MPHFVGWTTAAVAGLAAVVIASLLGGCAAADPNDGLLDAKYAAVQVRIAVVIADTDRCPDVGD